MAGGDQLLHPLLAGSIRPKENVIPFLVNKAAAHRRRVLILFDRYEQSVTLHYNAGKKYREYQKKALQLEQEFNELSRKLQSEKVSDEDYHALTEAMAGARRRLADNICTVIEKWDLQAKGEITLDDIKAMMSEADRKEWENVSGEGDIPVSGAWLDGLPLPDEFIIQLQEAITTDFDGGGSGEPS